MKRIFLLFLMILGLAGCSNESKEINVSLNFQQQNFPLILWKTDQSHSHKVQGQLTVNSLPVSGAVMLIDEKMEKTDSDGKFEFFVDQSKFSKKMLRVKDVTKATIDGKFVQDAVKDHLLAVRKEMNIYYPIIVKNVKEKAGRLTIQLRAITDNDTRFPTVGSGKFAMKGTIQDYKGKPVEGAVVSTTREKGEGWAQSKPTNYKGEYVLSFILEDDEDQTFRVTVGSTQYTLPKNRVYRFPNETSLEIHARLPKEGSLIVDKPPTLISKTLPGAVYSGIIIGLDGLNPKTYKVTIPDENGFFTLTISKQAWSQHPTFYQTRIMNEYDRKSLVPGDRIPLSWLKGPRSYEPSGIHVE